MQMVIGITNSSRDDDVDEIGDGKKEDEMMEECDECGRKRRREEPQRK